MSTDTTNILPESVQFRISNDAKKLYPINLVDEDTSTMSQNARLWSEKEGYIDGATTEALRAQKLIYALENIARGTHNAETVYQFALRAQQFAREVLKEYNQLP